ncbi:MAG: diguanylate cyclase [Sulfuricurvum sp.]
MNFDNISDLSLRSNFSSNPINTGLKTEKLHFVDYIINHINNLIFVLDRHNRFVYVNDSVVQKYHYSREELLKMSIRDLDIHFDSSLLNNIIWNEYTLKKTLQFRTIHKTKEGSLYPVLVHTNYIEYKNQVYSIGVIEDESYIQKLLDTQDGFFILTDGIQLIMANKKMLNFFGFSDFLTFMSKHKCICEFFIEENGFLSNQPKWIHKALKYRNGNAKAKIKNPATNEDHIFLVRASPFDKNRFVVTFTDITHSENYKSKLELLAITDGMTSLFNRRYFNKILLREINRTKRNNAQLAFIMLDVDFFKLYNDTYGHLRGDDVLISIANTIQKHFNRASDFCFRLGGEEFGIICTVNTVNEIYHQAEQLRIDIENLHIEHLHNNVSNYITASIGIAVCDGSITAEILYSQADVELYKAKESGRNKVCMNCPAKK